MLFLMSYFRDKKYPIKFQVRKKWEEESSHMKDRLSGVDNMQKQSKHKKRK